MTIEAARLSVVVDADTRDAESGLGRMGSVVGGAAHGLATAALGAVGFAAAVGGAAFGASMSLQDALAPMGTLLGTSSQQFADLSGQVTTFVSNSSFSADDIGMAAYQTLSAGITDTTKVMDTLNASQQLALAGLGDIGQANDLVTSAMAAFSGEGLTADRAAQLLFGTIASGKTTTAGLAQGFGQIAPLASAAGVSFNDLLAATAALTSTGQDASVAYSGIRGALTAIIAPSAEAAETAKKLGLDFSQAHLAAVGLPAFLNEVKAATGGNVETMAQLFGGVEGLNTVMSLTGPQAAAFASNLTGIGDAGQNLSARAEEMSNTTSNTFAEMKNKATVALSMLGDHIAAWLMPRVQQAQEWISAHWPEIQRVAGQVFGAVSQFVESVLVPALEKVIAGGQAVVGWIVDHWPQISQAFGEVVAAVQQAWEQYGRPIMEGIVAAGQAVVGWIVDHWPQISATISTVMHEVGEVVGAVLEIVSALWNKYGSTILAYVEKVWNFISDAIAAAMHVVQGVIDVVMGIIHGDWSRVWDGIKAIFSGVWDAMVAIVTFAIDTIKTVLSMAWETIKSVASTAWDGLKHAIGAAIDGIVDFVTKLPGRAVSALSSLGSSLLNVGTSALGELWSGVTAGWDAGFSFFTGLPGRVIGALSTWGQKLRDLGSSIIHEMWGGIKDAWNWLADKTTFKLPTFHIYGTDIDIGGGTINLLPHLAKGGVLNRPTAFVGGEYPGAASNPEIVTPESLLRGVFRAELQPLLSGAGGGGGGFVQHNTITVVAAPGREQLAGDAVVDALLRFERESGPLYVRAAGSVAA